MFGRRWRTAALLNDPERAYFGLGPCGEYLYHLYKEGRIREPIWYPGYGRETIFRSVEELRRRVEELEKKLEKSQ